MIFETPLDCTWFSTWNVECWPCCKTKNQRHILARIWSIFQKLEYERLVSTEKTQTENECQNGNQFARADDYEIVAELFRHDGSTLKDI